MDLSANRLTLSATPHPFLQGIGLFLSGDANTVGSEMALLGMWRIRIQLERPIGYLFVMLYAKTSKPIGADYTKTDKGN